MEKGSSNRMRQPGGEEISASEHDWQEVLAALHTSDYERLLDLLSATGRTAPLADQAELIKIASQVCLACIHCRSEVQWHRQARRKAHERERELRQGLEAILAAIISDTGTLEPGVGPQPVRSLLSPPSPEKATPAPRKSLGIWERMQHLLRFPSKQVSTPEHENLLSSAEDDEDLVTPLAEEEKEKNRSMVEIEQMGAEEADTLKDNVPSLVVYCLGPFQVYQDEQPVEEWPSSKGKIIFKYLVTHRERPVPKEVLMELLWPDNDPDAARNNLNVAVYGLRQALRSTHPHYSHVLYQDDCYLLNPEIDIWLDSELFMRQIALAQSLEQAGELARAMEVYNNAEALWLGEFMEEDRYEDWPVAQRQLLQQQYLKLLDKLSRYHFDRGAYNACTTACRKMLAVDPCREEAHRLMMQCFHVQGQSYLALRQYHQCVEALKSELQVAPSAATRELYELIRSQ
jgi:DNA-binding SARP family transcriptional activator